MIRAVWVGMFALVVLACGGDDGDSSGSDETSTTSTTQAEVSGTGATTSMSTTATTQTATTDPGACPPYEGQGDGCPVPQCCDESGKLWTCGCFGQCESNCCGYETVASVCIGPSGPDGIYTCGAGVAPQNVCPTGQRLGTECDPEVDGTGCCDDDNRAWQCDCTQTPCMWQMQDCNVHPDCA